MEDGTAGVWARAWAATGTRACTAINTNRVDKRNIVFMESSPLI